MKIYRIILLTLTLLCSYQAHAGLSIQSYTGSIDTITANDNNVLGDLFVGMGVGGTFTFNDDPSALIGPVEVDGVTVDGFNRYNAGMSLSLGGLVISLDDEPMEIWAMDRNSLPAPSSFERFTHGYVGPSEPQGGLIIDDLLVGFLTSVNDPITLDEPMPFIVDLGEFEIATWQLKGISEGGDAFEIYGTINSVSLVPEPATYTLIAGSLVLLGVFCRNRRIE